MEKLDTEKLIWYRRSGNEIKKIGLIQGILFNASEKICRRLFKNSVQNNKANAFKEKYRKYDVLIMDDIQFLSNKEKSSGRIISPI